MPAFASSLNWVSSTDVPKTVKEYELSMHEQVMAECPALDGGWIPKFVKSGVHGVVIVNAGGGGSVRRNTDGGTRAYGARTPKKLFYYPSLTTGGLKMGAETVHQTKSAEDGVDLVVSEFDAIKEELAREMGLSVFGTEFGTVNTATTLNVSTTTTVADPSFFEPGQQVDVVNGSDVFQETVTIVDVAYAADPANDSTITFEGGGTAGACAVSWTTAFKFVLAGSGDAGVEAPITLQALAGTDTVMGLAGTATGYNWRGHEIPSVGTLAIKDLEDLEVQVFRRRKKRAKCYLTTKLNEQRYARLEDSKLEYASGSDLDRRGGGNLKRAGYPIICDESAGDGNWYLIPQGKEIQLQIFTKLGVDLYRDRSINNLPDMHMAEGSHNYLLPMSMSSQIRAEKRLGLGALTGVTG